MAKADGGGDDVTEGPLEVAIVVQPGSANQVGNRKVDNVLSTGAGLLASAKPGCTLQIQKILRDRGGKALRAAHPIEILDASIRGISLT